MSAPHRVWMLHHDSFGWMPMCFGHTKRQAKKASCLLNNGHTDTATLRWSEMEAHGYTIEKVEIRRVGKKSKVEVRG